jgi:C4-dicarboxylate-specific signal transduction histidine kinase
VINDIIAAQQSYASEGLHQEVVNMNEVLQDALTIYANSVERHSIKLTKELEYTSSVRVQKTKLVHVILNVLKNAKDSMVESGVEERNVHIRLKQEEDQVILEISDNGLGIKKQHLNKIFNHGFTTKKNGHGFGLHSSANYMTEMGGKIEVHNKKEGSGAIFVLKLPVLDEQEMLPGSKPILEYEEK